MAESNYSDGWDTEDPSSYSPFKFYFRTGGSNNSISKGVRLPMATNRMIEELIQSGKLKYKTFGDFVRDACYHRIHWIMENLSALELGVTDPTAFLRMASQWADHQEMMDQTDKLVTRFIEAMRNLRNIGQQSAARAQILNYYRDAGTINDPIWRDHFRRRLEDAFNISQEDLLDL